MPAYARRQIVDESVVGVYYRVSRCVRRAFLCGLIRASAATVYYAQRRNQTCLILARDRF